MEEYRKKTGFAPTRLAAASWSPIDVILEIEILNNAMATVGAAAYEKFEKVNSPNRGRYVYIDRVNPVNPDGKVEWDVSHKAKGKASTLPVVETSLGFDVSDTVSGRIPVRIGNFKVNPPILSDYWITNLNPFAGDAWDKTVESDMLRFTFTDENERIWYFDTRHKRGHTDNEECTDPNQLPNADMMSMGNYGVTERYYVIFRNTSNQPKTIKYYMETYSGVLVRHNLNNSWNINSMKTLYLPEVYNHPYKQENGIVGYIQTEGEPIEVRNNETWYYKWDSKLSQWKRISQETFLKFKEDKEHYKVDYYEEDLEKNVQKNREIFTVTIPPNTSEYKVVFETLLTTNMLGGQRHSLVVE